jgi:hypothetical protein
MESSITMHEPIPKLSCVLQLLIVPEISTLPAKESIFELTRVKVAIRFCQLALSLNYVGKDLTLVDAFDASAVRPGHLTVTVHLRIHKFTDVVAPVWPLENSEPVNLALN